VGKQGEDIKLALVICGKRYGIEMRPWLADDNASTAFARSDHGRRVIEIHPHVSQDESLLLDCLLHEIIHVLFSQAPSLRRLVVEGAEEALVGTLASLLADTLGRNGGRVARVGESCDGS